jgi:hypothetical protein
MSSIPASSARRNIPKLAGIAEIAVLGRVSKQRAGQIVKLPGFPVPVQELAMGPVWLEAEVSEFLATPRKPGRPPKDARPAAR